MPIEHACFISYARGQHNLIQRFMAQFYEALAGELEAYLDRDKLWIDREKLGVGDFLDSSLATAMCKSGCFIVVFVPRYSRSDWCLKELSTALHIEEERISKLNISSPKKGLVIPIVLRGRDDDLPDALRERLWGDFRKMTTANLDISTNVDHMASIAELAQYISDVFKAFEDASKEGIELDIDCESAMLEPPLPSKSRKQLLPGRTGKPQ